MTRIDNEDLFDPKQPKYILQSDGNWHKVPQNQPKAYVGAFRCYFKAPSTASARALMMNFGDDDQMTGIGQTLVRTIDNDGTQHYYDLNGRRLSDRPQKGIYIYKGKKYSEK
jgi:imidazole glycerol phosphate synthase subunit HisF